MRDLTVDELELVSGGRGIWQPFDSTEDPRGFYFEISSASREMAKQDWCGSTGTHWVPDAPLGFDISRACQAHDSCYSTGPGRYNCDLQFLVDVFNLCRANGGADQTCSAVATAYFMAVRGFGWSAYEGP